MLPDLSSEGMRHVVALMLSALGDPHHQCPRCKNAFASTCRVAHTWFNTRFDGGLDSARDPAGHHTGDAVPAPLPARTDLALNAAGL